VIGAQALVGSLTGFAASVRKPGASSRRTGALVASGQDPVRHHGITGIVPLICYIA